MTNIPTLDSLAIINRMKRAVGLKTDSDLAAHLKVSNKTISSWRTRNSLPIESLLQLVIETGRSIDYFLFGAEEASKQDKAELLKFDDIQVRDFELAGETVLATALEKYAPEQLSFMTEHEMRINGESLGFTILSILALVRQERRALLDTGKMSEETFESYVRKAFRSDLPHTARAAENLSKKKGNQ
ncbi:MAG: helix-turn-helix domain-containing protein [Hoeflea sp.]|nr:helix-turn-helix domain-containing protein [Hoeflea sp.]